MLLKWYAKTIEQLCRILSGLHSSNAQRVIRNEKDIMPQELTASGRVCYKRRLRPPCPALRKPFQNWKITTDKIACFCLAGFIDWSNREIDSTSHRCKTSWTARYEASKIWQPGQKSSRKWLKAVNCLRCTCQHTWKMNIDKHKLRGTTRPQVD